MMIGVKGKQLCAGNPNADDRRTDGQTDMVIPVYPPNFVAGGIISTNTPHQLQVTSLTIATSKVSTPILPSLL